MSVEHYENFPVASWLCPAPLRPTVVAIYWFARTADDLADEGDLPQADRLGQLAAYREALERLYRHDEVSPQAWPQVFMPLRAALRQHALPQALLQDLLSAFEQDVRNPLYPTRAELLDYCRRSANPIGRLLLHLYGIGDAHALRRSDRVCTALQLINFWQDLSVDLPRGRCYLPLEDLQQHGLHVDALRAPKDDARSQALVRTLCTWAEEWMHEGAPLVHQVPGRAGWELRLVVQGGLRVLERIARMDHRTLERRPTLRAWDGPLLLLRALTMREASGRGAP